MSHLSSEAFEDGLDLQIGLVEAFIPNIRSDWTGYPFPQLKPLDEQEMRTFRSIILENAYLRVTVLPGLGGRIISLYDKRTGSEVLRRHPAIEPQGYGRRGTCVREGIQLFLDGEERLNALGNVDTQIELATDEDADAIAWVAETFTGTGLSFHLKICLPSDRAELQPENYNGAISAYLGDGTFDGSAFYSRERNAGLAIFCDERPFDGIAYQDGSLKYARFAKNGRLAARQVDNWSLVLVPFSGIGILTGAGREGAVSIESGELTMQCTQQRLGHKLLLLTEEGQTVEAKVDLYPENLLKIPLGGLNPRSLVLRDPGKNEVLRFDTVPRPWVQQLEVSKAGANLLSDFSATVDSLSIRSPALDLQRGTFDLSTRHLAHTLLGMRALAEKRYREASESFEQAHMYNADDPLAWWTKAVALRLSEEDNQAELLNAHYLAPLEPALRAESFLSQPIDLDGKPNPLLEPLEESPEEFIDVACLLIECGLYDQASRWIDEAIRHRDLPMLRYLMAYCLKTATRLDAEASDQVRLAAESPIAPPFPFRTVEIEAIRSLLTAFPDDQKLKDLMAPLDYKGSR